MRSPGVCEAANMGAQKQTLSDPLEMLSTVSLAPCLYFFVFDREFHSVAQVGLEVKLSSHLIS